MAANRALLLILSAAFLLEEAGPISHPLALGLGLVPLSALVISCFPRTAMAWRGWQSLAGLLFVLGGGALLGATSWYRPLGLALVITGASRLERARAGRPTSLDSLAIAALAGAGFLGLLDSTALGWYALELLARASSAVGAFVTASPARFGSSYLGLRLIPYLLVCALVFRAAEGLRGPRLLLRPAAAAGLSLIAISVFAAALPFLYSLLSGPIPDDAPSRWSVAWRYVLANLPLLSLPLALLNAIGFAIPARPAAELARTMDTRPSRSSLAAAGAFGLLALGALALPPRGSIERGAEGPVLLYRHGFHNWERPSFATYGEYSGGMFGNLPRMLASLGIRASIVDELSPRALEGARALVLINQERPLPADQLENVWSFVRGGGSLLVMGDHTFWKQGRTNWVNQILEPSHIRLNFDSADFFIGGWLHSYQYRPHPLGWGMRDDRNQPGIVIGASLDIAPPARPVIVGRFGYSDLGVASADTTGHLGNLAPDRGERVGDLVLVAEERVGAGTLLVFGDTSGFTNLIGVRSQPFLARVFGWLGHGAAPRAFAVREGLALLLLLGALGVAAGLRPDPMTAALALGAAFLLPASRLAGMSAAIERVPRGDVAYVDESHAERFASDGWRDFGTIGLHLNLLRNGYQVIAMDPFDVRRLRDARLLVLIAPGIPFTARERAAVRDFVSRGGALLLCAGYEETGPIGPLLMDFGLEVRDTPLGGVRAVSSAGAEVAFREAWPVSAERGDTLVRWQDFPLAVARQFGRGDVVLVGDSFMLLNTNLEHEDHPHVENIEFLRWLVETRLSPRRPLANATRPPPGDPQ